MEERYLLAMERIQAMIKEESVAEPYRAYFKHVAAFLIEIDRTLQETRTGERTAKTAEELQQNLDKLYFDVLPEYYEDSYANPAYARKELGEELGVLLSALYTELRADIAYAYEGQMEYIVIGNELFIEMYNQFEEEIPSYENLKDIFYWYASDYCDVFVADRILEQIDPQANDFAVKIIMESDLTDLRYLYQYGEYIGENERKTAEYLNGLPQETIDKMADTYTEGYRLGFVHAGIDLSKKATVNVCYLVGFERVMRRALQNFAAMGLEATIYRAAVSVTTRKRAGKTGYFSTNVNKQYDYDHKDDMGLILDKQFVERKLEVMRTVFEQNKELAGKHAGPAVLEGFGEKPFSPETKKETVSLDEKQEQLLLNMNARAGQITNQYIKGEERSFTIISWPIPEIGDKYQEIFDETIRINTLDSEIYGKVQQTIIDALDQGDYVHIQGAEGNKTDLKVKLYELNDPEKETIFENCVADVNIPVGEVFTSPVLEGTEGVLFVSEVYLHELQYRDLEIHFKEGRTTDYTCGNFESEEENQKYVRDTILFNHQSLPLGEFAIGTNTTAYAAAKKYRIADKFTVLIAEKMGPHFAVGDTCYSWAEDNPVYNPDGKEIVARENSACACRKENPEKAYFQCHTDITLPYNELGKISIVAKDGREIVLIRDGRFVLPGTEMLNEALDEL